MRRLPNRSRALALAAFIAAGITAASPKPAQAQWVVFDPANLGQAVTGYVQDGLAYALQLLEYAEAVQGVIHLGRQIQQLDSTFAHMRDAANGRVGQLTDAFAALSATDASTLLDADFGAWRGRLTGTSNDLATALSSMQDASLSDFLLNELDAADLIGEADLRALYPGDPDRNNQLADGWTEVREHGDRLRAGDLAVAEAAGRLATVLQDAQTDIDGRRGQGQLSHTALQQAQIANQLTGAEIEFARSQLLAIQAQQGALVRHEAELQDRLDAERWVQNERARAIQHQQFLNAEDARRAAARNWGRLPG
ncbi:MAG: hypothetical protein OXN18_15445 [Gemmatimonadota bacterium]|nr:hypothetical protein [Gemmatimonadota bacterium]